MERHLKRLLAKVERLSPDQREAECVGIKAVLRELDETYRFAGRSPEGDPDYGDLVFMRSTLGGGLE